MWMLPVGNLFYGDKVLKNYRHRPVGNSPELCNLDFNLNQEVHLAATNHINTIMELKREDLQKSLMATVKAGIKAYCRVFYPNTDTAPSLRRIIKDSDTLLQQIVETVKAFSCVILDSNNRTGH